MLIQDVRKNSQHKLEIYTPSPPQILHFGSNYPQIEIFCSLPTTDPPHTHKKRCKKNLAQNIKIFNLSMKDICEYVVQVSCNQRWRGGVS